MICAYIDEAGNTGLNLQDQDQPFHYVAAIMFHDSVWMEIKNDLDRIMQIASSQYFIDPAAELHGTELFQGKKAWKCLEGRKLKRMAILDDCLNLMSKYNIQIVYGRTDKQMMTKYKNPIHPQDIAFMLCLERIGTYLCEKQEIGYLVADKSCKKMENLMTGRLCNYRKHGPIFGKPVDISRIIDTLHFIDSSESRHLQLCDLALFTISRQERWKDVAELNRKVSQQVRTWQKFPYGRTN